MAMAREATMRLTAMLKELQEFPTRTSFVLHVTTVSSAFHVSMVVK